jgi:hypothetical protein
MVRSRSGRANAEPRVTLQRLTTSAVYGTSLLKRGVTMLQIIGLLGCVYLLVKAFDILGSANHRKASGSLSAFSVIGVFIAFLGSILFALILLSAGAAPSPY